MRIEILDLWPGVGNGGATGIAFSGTYGRAWAGWRGSEEPVAGAFADVEVDIPDEITCWAVADGPAIIASDSLEAPVRIRGVVESADEDSVLALRVGADLLLVEVAAFAASLLPGHVDKPRVGDSIEITTSRIDVHPYSV
ncbi:hypothetical protein [Streptomyces collinus]|uniref:hypothetical protein n=1 Tax=Streptomyces collinus TaxID=42684 RepID=UPI0036C19AE5